VYLLRSLRERAREKVKSIQSECVCVFACVCLYACVSDYLYACCLYSCINVFDIFTNTCTQSTSVCLYVCIIWVCVCMVYAWRMSEWRMHARMSAGLSACLCLLAWWIQKRTNTERLHQTSTHCNTLQHTATQYNTLQHKYTGHNIFVLVQLLLQILQSLLYSSLNLSLSHTHTHPLHFSPALPLPSSTLPFPDVQTVPLPSSCPSTAFSSILSAIHRPSTT